MPNTSDGNNNMNGFGGGGDLCTFPFWLLGSELFLVVGMWVVMGCDWFFFIGFTFAEGSFMYVWAL